MAKGDIELRKYKGYYDVKEESFVTDLQAEEMGYKDKAGNPLELNEEEDLTTQQLEERGCSCEDISREIRAIDEGSEA